MAGIDQLTGQISAKGGLAKPNVFSVMLPSYGGVTTQEMNILCRDVQLPGRAILTYDKVVGVKNEKVAYGAANDDVSMSFLVLNDFGVRRYFEDWQRKAFDPDTYQMGYKSDYTGQITISQMKKGFSFPVLNRSFDMPNIPTSIKNRLPSLGPINFAQGEIDLDFATPDAVVYTCTLHEAWPTSFEAISLTNELDGLMEMRAVFSYSKWTSTTSTQQSNRSYLTDLAIGSVITNVFK
jgi:hypothetical protein